MPVGEAEYVTFKLRNKAEEIIGDGESTVELLVGDRQSLLTALRLSISQRFSYFLQLSPPSLAEPVAAELDSAIWRMFEAVCGFKVPWGNEQGGLTLRVPVQGLDGRSFQEWTVRLPARLYGWGICSLEGTCGPAYLGALETAIPYMAGRGKVCPQMAGVWGVEESWGEKAPEESRWVTLLQSGCEEGREVEIVWNRLQGEARAAHEWLGRDLEGTLSVSARGLGEGSVSGSTRSKIMEAVENTRSLLLTKALEDVRPLSTRAAWAWKQRDKVSSAWLQALPGFDTSLTSAEFGEAAATSLCLPSPACKGRVGEVIRGRVTVDEYGDNVQATSLPGDHWRARHNQILHLLHCLCLWAGLPVEMEVFNLFSGLVQQEGLSRVEKTKQRQALVPDMRITMPDPVQAGVT